MRHYKKIDGLRCVAVSFVLIEHYMFYLGKHFSAGYYGVDLFFVISGLLITNILLQPDGRSFLQNYTRFLSRRSLRIFPLYFLVVFLLWLLNFSEVRVYILYILTYTFNYAWVYYHIPLNPAT